MANIFNKVLAAGLIMASMPTAQAVSKEERLTKRLFRAIENGNIEAVRKAIAAGANVNISSGLYDTSIFEHNPTPLMAAVRLGNIKIVRLLLEKKVQIDADWPKILLCAARYGHKEICEILLVNYYTSLTSDHCSKALIYAAAYGHISTCKVLLAVGANPSFSDEIDCYELTGTKQGLKIKTNALSAALSRGRLLTYFALLKAKFQNWANPEAVALHNNEVQTSMFYNWGKVVIM